MLRDKYCLFVAWVGSLSESWNADGEEGLSVYISCAIWDNDANGYGMESYNFVLLELPNIIAFLAAKYVSFICSYIWCLDRASG